jgi:hypothetical protein
MIPDVFEVGALVMSEPRVHVKGQVTAFVSAFSLVLVSFLVTIQLLHRLVIQEWFFVRDQGIV